MEGKAGAAGKLGQRAGALPAVGELGQRGSPAGGRKGRGGSGSSGCECEVCRRGDVGGFFSHSGSLVGIFSTGSGPIRGRDVQNNILSSMIE
jgi:hypothetical protein